MTQVARASERVAVDLARNGRRLALVGGGAGLLAGLLGIGGGIVLVPGLAWAARLNRRTATGTSLVAIVPISIVAAASYITAPNGRYDIAASGVVLAGSLAGAVLGVMLNARMTDRGLRLAFAAVSGLLGLRLVVPLGLKGDVTHLTLTAGTVAVLVLLGLIGGVLSGLLGVGGSAMIAGLMVLVLGAEQPLAQGIAIASVIPTALIGALAHARRNSLAVRAGITAGMVGAVTSIPAVLLALAVPSAVLRTLFGLFLVSMSVRTLSAQLAPRRV